MFLQSVMEILFYFALHGTKDSQNLELFKFYRLFPASVTAVNSNY